MARRAVAVLAALAVVACSKTTPESSPRAAAESSAPKPPPQTLQRETLELPKAPPKLLERRTHCTDRVCKLEGWLPDAAFAKSTAGAQSPAAIWLHEIRGGSSVLFPRHTELDVVAVVLEGVLVASTDDEQQALGLSQWSAVHAPGAGLLLRVEQSDATVVILVAAKLPTLGEALARGKAQAWQERPGTLRRVELAAAEDLAWGGGAFHARIAFGGEGPRAQGASLQVLQAKAGSVIPEHTHPSWEHIAILDGRGRFQMGGTEYAVEPGKIFHIPKGVRHAFRGAQDAPLLAVQSYTPSGEEQRFVRLAKGVGAPKRP